MSKGFGMLSRRRLLAAPLMVGATSALLGSNPIASASESTPEAAVDTNAVLDGNAPVDSVALAELARVRVKLAEDWLAAAQRPTGVFYYIYDPVRDEYETTEYNEVRHAGTTYALF